MTFSPRVDAIGELVRMRQGAAKPVAVTVLPSDKSEAFARRRNGARTAVATSSATAPALGRYPDLKPTAEILPA